MSDSEKTILVVDDKPTIQNVCEAFLKSKGYKVFLAKNGVEALQLIDRHGEKIDLMLTDIEMPEMNGIQLIKKLSERSIKINIILMSGCAILWNEIKENLLFLNIPFFQKPFNMSELSGKIKEILNES